MDEDDNEETCDTCESFTGDGCTGRFAGYTVYSEHPACDEYIQTISFMYRT